MAEQEIVEDIRHDNSNYGETPIIEDETGVKRFIAQNQGKTRFRHLVEDINFSILEEQEKLYITACLKLRRLMGVLEGNDNKEGFGMDLEHDILSVAHVSSAYKGRKLDKMLSTRSSKSYEIVEQEKKRNRLGMRKSNNG